VLIRKTKQLHLNIHYKSNLFLKQLKKLLNINCETFMIIVINIMLHGKNTRGQLEQFGHENRILNIHNKFHNYFDTKRQLSHLIAVIICKLTTACRLLSAVSRSRGFNCSRCYPCLITNTNHETEIPHDFPYTSVSLLNAMLPLHTSIPCT
jgi:hypothetical protein